MIGSQPVAIEERRLIFVTRFAKNGDDDLFPFVRRKRAAALRLVFHLLGGIETRRHTIVTSPDWTGTTSAGRDKIVMLGSVGIPREYAKISSFGVDPAGTMRLSNAPESDGAQYCKVHSRVCSQ